MAEEILATGGIVSGEMIETIANEISRGGVVILPTDTIYGLHCDARNETAVARIFDIKKRERRKPLIVLAADIDQVRAMGVRIDPALEGLLQSIWPAPFTAILPLGEPVAASAGERSLAVRIPRTEWLRGLIRRAGPIASTSVNVSGEPAMYTMDSAGADIRSAVDLVLDSGPLKAQASTVVDFTDAEPRLIREGAFLFSQELWKTRRKSL